MKKKLLLSRTLLTLILAACAGQTPPASNSPEPVEPAQAASPTSAVSAATPADAQPSTTGVSYSKDVMPIFENSCTNCHGVDQIKKGLDMRTYESLMAGSDNGPVIVAGKAADSLLFQQVADGKMPKRGPKLTPAQVKTISDWINAGALNN